jgi:hypothetical protein
MSMVSDIAPSALPKARVSFGPIARAFVSVGGRRLLAARLGLHRLADLVAQFWCVCASVVRDHVGGGSVHEVLLAAGDLDVAVATARHLATIDAKLRVIGGLPIARASTPLQSPGRRSRV